MDVHGVSLFTASSLEVQARVYPFLPSYNVFKFQNVGVSGVRSVRYRNDLPMPGAVRYRKKATLVQYRIVMSDAGMPIQSGIDLETCAQLCSVKVFWGRCLSVAEVPTLALVLLLLGSYCCWSPCSCLLTFLAFLLLQAS